MNKRKIYPVTLRKAGIEVLMAELRPTELVNAMKLAGNDVADAVRGRRVSRQGVRLAIREVNGQPVTYSDLDGAGWRKFFPRTRHAAPLVSAWAQIHLPGQAEMDAVEASMVPTIDGDIERWSLELPGPRRLEMVEQTEETVEAALRAAETAARSQAAQSFLSTIESVRRALRTVDGKGVTEADLTLKKWDELFSVRETYLLGHAFSVIHGADEEAAVGEARPVSGTGSPG